MNSDQMVNWINIIAYEFWVEMLFQEKKKKKAVRYNVDPKAVTVIAVSLLI